MTLGLSYGSEAMLTKKQYKEAQQRALAYMLKAGVVLSEEEKEKISIADFGLNDLEHQGGQILTFFNTDRISAKIIVLFPWQILPEHWHPAIGRDIGKEEVMRVRWGEVYLYVPKEWISTNFLMKRYGKLETLN